MACDGECCQWSTDFRFAKNMLIQVCIKMEEHGGDLDQVYGLRDWFEYYKRDALSRLEAEATEALRTATKEAGLAKLSYAEKKELGLMGVNDAKDSNPVCA